ncbi:MAG TPA: hypothetical protein VN844_07910 [Pyrinomonadaceae bacterium]|nr:hypothetical protein [Pyrinomonadaceae bacterium]
MTSISKEFVECNLRSNEVIEALKSGHQAVIDQVASKLYANMLSVADPGILDAPDWSKKDEKLKWVLHAQVAVFGDILNIEDLSERVRSGNFENHQLVTDLAYELKFFLLDLLGLDYELNYSTWNLIGLFTPDSLTEEQLARFVRPAVQTPFGLDSISPHEDNATTVILNQALTNWSHWCQVYKTLMILNYEGNENDTVVAFHSLLAVSANLISASHIGSLLLFFRANALGRSMDKGSLKQERP